MNFGIDLLAPFVSRAFVCAALPVTVLAASARAQDAAVFHHGVSIHDAMNWATMDSAKKRYVFPPFSDKSHPLGSNELAIIRKAGFDFVRLTIDPGPFLQLHGTQLDATYAILRQRVQTILAADLSVIIDFHPVDQDLDYGSRAVVEGSDTLPFGAYCIMLVRTASMLTGLDTDRVALELMNEPNTGLTPTGEALWQTMEEKAYTAVRAVAPNLKLVLTGSHGNDAGLLALDPGPFEGDRHTIYTFHYYDPGEFVFQSLPSDENMRLAADIPYPAQARPLSDGIQAITRHVAKLDSSITQRAVDVAKGVANLMRYRESNFDRDNIRSTFDKVAAWARTNNIPSSRIFLGEFGVMGRTNASIGARDSERALWLTDVREEAEAHGFFWSIWAYRGPYMAIVKNAHSEEIDPPTLRALGLAR